MIKSSITISLVPESKGGPFVLWQDLAASCRKAAALGFDAVEVFAPNARTIKKEVLQDILARNNLKLAALGTGAGFLLNKLYLCDPDRGRRREAIEFIAEIIKFGGSFGAMAIIGSMQGSIPKELARSKAEDWLREGLNQLGALANKYNVALLVEPLNRYETNFINRLGQGVEMIKSLENDNVKLLADLFHMNIEEESVCDALRQAAGYIGHIHFVDSNRRPAGCGHTDFAEVGRTLREIGYDGYVSAEALSYPNPEAAAEQTMRSFKQYIRQN